MPQPGRGASTTANYRALFSESSGNNVRLAFLYDTKKITVGDVDLFPAFLLKFSGL